MVVVRLVQCFGGFPGCCYVVVFYLVTKVLWCFSMCLCSCKGALIVVRWLVQCFGWFPGCC